MTRCCSLVFRQWGFLSTICGCCLLLFFLLETEYTWPRKIRWSSWKGMTTCCWYKHNFIKMDRNIINSRFKKNVSYGNNLRHATQFLCYRNLKSKLIVFFCITINSIYLNLIFIHWFYNNRTACDVKRKFHSKRKLRMHKR